MVLLLKVIGSSTMAKSAKAASSAKEIEFTIKPDGTVEADLLGYKGQGCAGDIQDILNALGGKKKTTKKQEYKRDKKVRVSQKR